MDDDALAQWLSSNGWTECPPQPDYDAATQAPPVWDIQAEQWAVRDLTTQELACVQGEAIRQAMLADFGQTSPGVQAYFAPLASQLKELLQSGQIADAKAILQTAPAPAAELETLRAQLLAHFPAE